MGKVTLKDVIHADAKNFKVPEDVSKKIWSNITPKLDKEDEPKYNPGMLYDGDYPPFDMTEEEIANLI